MAKALSVDLRCRVLAAIDGGLSCRQAAIQFGVSAFRWNDQRHKRGEIKSKPQGGDRRSGRIEAHATLILALVDKTSDITLAELQAKLNEQGLHFGIGTLWRFFDRRRITYKKSPRMQPSRTGPIF